MTRRDVHDRVKDKIEQRMERLRSKLEQLPKVEEILQKVSVVETALANIEVELRGVGECEGESSPGLGSSLAAQRERLLAQLERLELQKTLAAERREHLLETLEDLQDSFTRRDYVQSPRVTSTVHIDSQRIHEERRKILELVQDGKITASEAASLLDALRDQTERVQKLQRKPRWVRIRVTDADKGRVRVNLTLPVGVVRAGLRAGGSIAGIEGVDAGELEEMLNRGQVGHILDLQDEDSHERVEVFIE